ncbi:hypothetical protein [Phenylobacterium sp.]|uniref:hypothetical protein n=1 Tax=Phenylobacterium sp. TaxID=1871053 RepID=UPI0030F3D4B3
MNLRTANRRRRDRSRVFRSPYNFPYIRYIKRLYGKTLDEAHASVGFTLRATNVDTVDVDVPGGVNKSRLNVSIRDGVIVDVWDFG